MRGSPVQARRHPLPARRAHHRDRLGRRPQGRLPARDPARLLPVRRLPGALRRDQVHRATQRHPAGARGHRARRRLRARAQVVRRPRQRHLQFKYLRSLCQCAAVRSGAARRGAAATVRRPVDRRARRRARARTAGRARRRRRARARSRRACSASCATWCSPRSSTATPPTRGGSPSPSPTRCGRCSARAPSRARSCRCSPRSSPKEGDDAARRFFARVRGVVARRAGRRDRARDRLRGAADASSSRRLPRPPGRVRAHRRADARGVPVHLLHGHRGPRHGGPQRQPALRGRGVRARRCSTWRSSRPRSPAAAARARGIDPVRRSRWARSSAALLQVVAQWPALRAHRLRRPAALRFSTPTCATCSAASRR